MTKLRVLAAAHHFGSANAISPVIRLLDGDEGFVTYPLGLKPATIAFRENGFDFREWEDLGNNGGLEDITVKEAERVLGMLQPDLVLVGSSTEKEHNGPEKALTLAAKKVGLPTIGVLDFWGDYGLRLRDLTKGEPLGVVPDVMCVPDQFARDELIQAWVREGGDLEVGAQPRGIRIVPTGNPYHQTVADKARTFSGADRFSVREAMNIGEDDKVLFYVGNAFKAHKADGEHDHGYWDLDNILSLVRVNVMRPDLKIRVSLHGRMPEEEQKEIGDVIDQFYGIKLVDVKPFDGVLASDVVATPFSTCAVEAAIAGIPAISMQPGYEGDRLPTNRIGVTFRADDAERALPAVEAFLEGGVGKYCPNFGRFKPDGRATENIVEQVYKLL